MSSQKIVLPIDVRQQIKDDLIKYGEVNILGVVTLKYKNKKIKGREQIDPKDPKKGFRITDMNMVVPKVSAHISEQFSKSFRKYLKEKKK